jgi:NADPH:quinone reductase-like Zn-dependent oxidoreductase
VQNVGGEISSNAEVLAELAALVATGDLDVPIAATYPLDDVHAAYRTVMGRHTHGKIVLLP